MLTRLLFLCLIICIGFFLLRAFLTNRRQRSKEFDRAQPNGEEMVLDPQCGSYLPRGEAIVQEGRYFCSRECAKLYLSR